MFETVDLTPEIQTREMLLIDRLSLYFGFKGFNKTQNITMEDITSAIRKNTKEQTESYGIYWVQKELKQKKSNKWHLGRIIYFINHPEEIKEIRVENIFDSEEIYPFPIIIDGHHRLLAAMWLHYIGKMDKVHCNFKGRKDTLDYFTGKLDDLPII